LRQSTVAQVNEEKQRAIEKARLEAQERVALLEKRNAEEHDRPRPFSESRTVPASICQAW
jgi:hypothetical protein